MTFGWHRANASTVVCNDVETCQLDPSTGKFMIDQQKCGWRKTPAPNSSVTMETTPTTRKHIRNWREIYRRRHIAMNGPQWPIDYIVTAPIRFEATLNYASKPKMSLGVWDDDIIRSITNNASTLLLTLSMSRKLTVACAFASYIKSATRSWDEKWQYEKWVDLAMSLY